MFFKGSRKVPLQTKAELQSPWFSPRMRCPPAPCGSGTWRGSSATCLGTSVTPGTPAAQPVLSAQAAATALPQGQGSTHDFRDEEHIWEGRQDGQAAGQSAGGS